MAPAVVFAYLNTAHAYDAEAGRQKAKEACAGCHGPDGNSQLPTVPSLAGQLPRYLILALYQFRAGHRKSEQMTPFAAELSDEDMGNLAAYYAVQQPAPQELASQTHFPDAQVVPLPQTAQATPPVPQVGSLDVWHLPLESQQPFGQEVALQTHLPPLQAWPG